MTRLFSARRFTGLFTNLSLLLVVNAATAQPASRPNLILIVTDDQQWTTIDSMPKVQTYFAQQGIAFTNAFATTALCSPSRASILTGQYAHHHGVHGNNPPNGGFAAFNDASTIATWLRTDGYRTGLYGKYLNGYTGTYVPPGWNEWHAFIAELDLFYNYDMNENGAINHYGGGAGDYSTDVLADKAVDFIHANNGSPFFLCFAPSAAHDPATPAPRHQTLFSNLAPWRPPSYNEANVSDKPVWLQNTPLLTTTERADIDSLRKKQYRSLQAVDEAVEDIIEAVNDIGAAQNTIIIFMGDNGYLWGEHRLTTKNCAFEEAVRIPLLIRAPGIITGPRVENRFVLNIDIAPTLAEYAGVIPPTAGDGNSLVSVVNGTVAGWRTDFWIEHWKKMEGRIVIPEHLGVRNANWKYLEYVDGDKELYDLVNDPDELTSHANDPAYAATQLQLATRLLTLKTVRGCNNKAPVAAFTATPTSGAAPLTVNFTDYSTNYPTAWSWNFGDGGTSTAPNPSHQYTTPGIYTLTLTASNGCGNAGLTKTDYLIVNGGQVDLTHNKTTTASSTASGYPPSNAVDDNTGTHWRSGTPGSNTIVWWSVDLGATYNVNNVVIHWRTNFYATEYRIQTSLDGDNWTTVYTDKSGNGGTDNVTFQSAATNHIRLRMSKNKSSTERLNEVEVYAAASPLAKRSEVARSEVIMDYVLEQNYPNPFNPSTQIAFSVPRAAHVSLKVYNLIGAEVATLVDEMRERGNHTATFDASRLTGGIYFAILQAGEVRLVRRLVYMK